MQARVISIKSVGVSRSYPALFSWAPAIVLYSIGVILHIQELGGGIEWEVKG